MTIPFELDQVRKAVVYKRDAWTVDLICCDVEVEAGDCRQTWTSHEEAEGWDELMASLARLPGFDLDWFAKVSQPAFAPCTTVIYERRPVA